jgi:hypothetical protein
MAEPSPTLGKKGARVVWFGVAASFVVAVAASLILAPAEPADALRVPLLLAAAPLTAVELAATYVLTASMRRRAAAAPVPPAQEVVAAVQVIVAAALAEGAALFACLCHYLTREPLFLLLAAACGAVIVHWYPSEARWARLLPRGPPGASRMIRQ